MVVKKKTPKVEAVALDRAVLESLTVSLSVDGDDDSKQIAQMLKDCLVMTDPVQQIQLVSKVGSMLECLKEDESAAGSLVPACLKTLAFIYLTLQAKNPLRRAIASALSNVPAWLQETAVCSLCVCLSESMSSLKSECYPHLTDCITSCLDAFPIGERCIHHLLTEVLQFFQKTMSEYLQLNRDLAGRHVAQAELMQSCLAVVKASMLVVQKSQELFSHRTSTLQEAFSGLLQCYTHILTDEQFIQAVQSTAGMALVLLIRSVIGNGNDTTDAVAGLLESSERDCTPQWLKQSCAGLYLSSRPAAVSLYLSHGALAMLNWRGRTLDTQAEKLLLLIPDIILSLDTRVKESSTVMVVTRVLTLWSIAAIDCLQFESPAPLSESPAHLIENPAPLLRLSLHGGSPLAERLLNHVYIHWEHPLDGVRHQARTLFRNLLSIHQLCGGPMADPTYDPYFNQLTQRLLGLEWHIKGKYGSLACLAEHLGAEYLLKLDGDLPSRLLGLMGDQTLAPYASELLEKLFVSHKAQLCACLGDGHAWMENWQRTWVKPLLEVLCTARLDQTTYILDYFLPKLLRCSPASLAHMIQALQEMPSEGSVGSRGPLGALMTCLRAARSQGVLGPVNEEIWGGLVPLSPLRQALLHKHDQVRMDALGLVCESHRSTEILSKQEMELIRHFLPSNLNSQSPGFRQQTISLLKKLLCRMKDSSQSLQRKLTQERDQQQRERDQHILSTYKEFLCWFCESLFMVLRPGASFSSCIVALQLLGLVADHFSFSMDSEGFALGEVVMVPHSQAVLYCLASNFLEVKQLACTLLQKLPPHTVALQDPEKLQCVLQAALDLSTSTKPFDSVTAAHLINLLLCQYDLQQTLLCCAQDQSLSLKLTALIQSKASQASLLEKNALAVMVFFKACLEDEVAQAEVSLLQAAASRPLYGRLHCITAVLQHLNNRSLQMQTEWMDVVSELIALCYRISDVVSPVIQSSSPEGLIPMDTDSETSAALQKILQEIQPRDTNDFFTCARKLDTTSQEQQKNNGTGSVGEAYRVTAQMVLVCCWRSMKEVSMLLGELCQSMPLHTPQTHKQNGLITEEQLSSHSEPLTLRRILVVSPTMISIQQRMQS